MIIDFHTHIFPERIAERTLCLLSQKSGFAPHTNGKAEGLAEHLSESGTDIAVSLPVVTAPSQFDSINRFAASVNEAYKDKSPRIISFAGIHPMCDDIDGKMAWIKEQGFLGVKIHPDYQDTFINDDGYIKILEAAKREDLTVVTHSGKDFGFRDMPVRCTPALVKEVIDRVGHPKFVLAHYGACDMHDEVYELLCGENVYFDTSFVLKNISKETFVKIMEKHGEDKILFATDSPWSNIKDDIAIIKSYGLSKETEEKLFSGNARRLLGI